MVGYSAARSLSRQGKKVLLVEASGDLLWESTRALENSKVPHIKENSAWAEWLENLPSVGSGNNEYFNPSIAEVSCAAELSNSQAPFKVLLYAAPVHLDVDMGLIGRMTVATKSGPKYLYGRSWIDATERATLLQLALPSFSPCFAATAYRSLVILSQYPDRIDDALPELKKLHPNLECFRSHRPLERRLRWSEGNVPWYRMMRNLVTDLKSLLGEAAENAFTVGHCGMKTFPVYDRPAELPATESIPANLHIMTPAFSPVGLVTAGDRFNYGSSANNTALVMAGTKIPKHPLPTEFPPASREITGFDVIVAGTGTAGALAALAAGRRGAKTLALDHVSFPGGVGTGGGINNYFHGSAGGLQDEVDALTRDLSRLLAAQKYSFQVWHHEGKKLALLELFESAKVEFLGDSWICQAEVSDAGRVESIHAVIDGELARISGQNYIDGTGDGDLCVHAGASFSGGRPGDQRTLAYSQSAFCYEETRTEIRIHSCNFDAGWVDPNDPEDLSRARLVGIAQHIKTKPVIEGRCLAIAPIIGLRQSRHIETDYKLAFKDLTNGSTFQDAIGISEGIADTHSVDYEFESDRLAFYYWTCRGFRNRLASELPYRMLLPKKLNNVWVPCRAAGLENDAAYAVRMQRDMQRLGEAAGYAAAIATEEKCGSREVGLGKLQSELGRTGALVASKTPATPPTSEQWLEQLDQGKPGIGLWHIMQNPELFRDPVFQRLDSRNANTSFYAAAILALWNEDRSEQRLIQAVDGQESGPDPESPKVPGPHNQCIDIPFWLQAVLLLRCVGGKDCLPCLKTLSSVPDLPLNVRTSIALTIERIASRTGTSDNLIKIIDLLSARRVNTLMPPSYSLWRQLKGLPQLMLRNESGADTREDQGWQLDLILYRILIFLGSPKAAEIKDKYQNDPRALVRQAFP